MQKGTLDYINKGLHTEKCQADESVCGDTPDYLAGLYTLYTPASYWP